MNINRRGFLGGIISAIVAPAIATIDYFKPKYNNISMRNIIDYNPSDDVKFTKLDVLYGRLLIRKEWINNEKI